MADPAVGPPRIGALMRLPAEALRRRLLDALHTRGLGDLVAAHLNVLRYPGPDGRRPSELAAETGMTKQAMNYLLRQLELRGYLARRDDPENLRWSRIDLTERGHQALAAIEQIMSSLESEIGQELGGRQMAELLELLAKLNATSVMRQTQQQP